MSMASMQCKRAGVVGTIVTSNKPLNGALAKLITNRYSGLLVELTQSHGPFSKGARFSIAPNEFVKA